MRDGLIRCDVRFFDDINIGRRHALAPFRIWKFSPGYRYQSPLWVIFPWRRSSPRTSCLSRPYRSSSRILRPAPPIWQIDSIRTSPWFCFRLATELILVREAEKNGIPRDDTVVAKRLGKRSKAAPVEFPKILDMRSNFAL